MMPDAAAPLVEPAEIEEIELQIHARVQDLIRGEHASIYSGTAGSDFTGLREWEPGDSRARIDWAHSTLTAFSPLVVQERVEPHALDVIIGADVSDSTRFGVGGMTIARVVARAIATIGLSAAIFQDSVGLVLYDFDEAHGPWIEPPHRGRAQALRLIDLYETRQTSPGAGAGGLAETIDRELRRTSLVFVISDFLFPDAFEVLRSLAGLKPGHDVVLGMVDAAFAFVLPAVSAGWIECVDAETGQSRILSAREAERLPRDVERHQAALTRHADKLDLDLARLSCDTDTFHVALLEMFLARKIHRK